MTSHAKGDSTALLSSSLGRRPSAKQCVLLVLLCFSSVLFIAILVERSHFRHRIRDSSGAGGRDASGALDPDEAREILFAGIDADRIADNLRQLTQEPHVAGTEANGRVADRLAALWRANGLEKVQQLQYDVLLSYPDWARPNHASVLDSAGKPLFRSEGLSPDLIPPPAADGGGNDIAAAIQWLAYSGNGTVEGEPVFCHYGRPEDFDRLEREFGLASLEGKIAVIRYGEEFRGDKVRHAQDRKAAGVILYSDPTEVAGDGADRAFPSSVWMPSGGVQRGSVMEMKGDPLTPLLPSKRDFFRSRTVEQAKKEGILPSIPVLPLGYADAQQILSRMAGPGVPADWQGGLGFQYRIGPGFRDKQGQRLRLEVNSRLETRTIRDLVGIIYGREEPDSWVMLGNHFDAWVFGSLDPNSGTAILAEVARSFANALRYNGWRPRRTLVFCAWDAEEHGLIGSTEFVQEYAAQLQDRAVVYLNLDLISSNQSLNVDTVPSLYQAVQRAAQSVPNPVETERKAGRPTMYDTWRMHYPPHTEWLPDTPRMNLPGGGSDHMSFLNFLGIPVVDFTYRNASWRSYPLYHSRYEVPFVNEHLFDRDHLAVHRAVGQFWAELARSFADSPLLPINATTSAAKLLKEYLEEPGQRIQQLHKKYPVESEVALRQLVYLIDQTRLFLSEAQHFERVAQQPEQTKWANRRLQRLEQCFLNPALGLAEREPEKRHVLFSLSDKDSYKATVMAAVWEKIEAMERQRESMARAQLGRQLALELTVVQQAVLCATNTLKAFF